MVSKPFRHACGLLWLSARRERARCSDLKSALASAMA